MNLVIELLIESNHFEVRESFGRLLTTALSVTAKNEEPFMPQVTTIVLTSFRSQARQLTAHHRLQQQLSS
jgi:hypothetical protein